MSTEISTTNKLLMAASISVNFAFLALLRAISTPHWVIDNPSSQTQLEYSILSLCIVLNITLQVLYKKAMRTKNPNVLPILALLFTIFGLTMWISLSYLIPYLKNSKFVVGGLPAVSATCIASLISLLQTIISVYVHKGKSMQCSMEEKTYELANSLFMWYVAFGGLLFTLIEGFSFEVAGEFSVVTLLTIGYGDILVKTSAGKIVMMIYTAKGILIATFFIIAFGDVLIQNELRKSLIQEIEDEEADLHRHKKSHQRGTIYIAIYIIVWWLAFSVIFALTEADWTFVDSLYYSFVSMAGIGYGDLQIKSAVAREFWWLFLLNAISVLHLFVSITGKILANDIGKKQLKQHRVRLLRRLKREYARGSTSRPTIRTIIPKTNSTGHLLALSRE